MILLSGAEVSIRYDRVTQQFIATVGVGYAYNSGVAKDPVTAIGQAVLSQAKETNLTLKKALAAYARDHSG